MEDNKIINEVNSKNELAIPEQKEMALAVNTQGLNEESLKIINQLIAESDIEKAKDLTYLFNANQNKKTLVRVNKLSELMDLITDQTIARVQKRPDEITTKELVDTLKITQDLIERGMKQASGVNDNAPLIQINQQNNELSVGDESKSLSRESKDKIKNAVNEFLNSLGSPLQKPIKDEGIVIEPEKDTEDSEEDD